MKDKKVENIAEENASVEAVADNKKAENDAEFKFFKCCSASLKRLAIITFVLNIFIAISIVGIGAVLLAVYIGTDLLALLALPLVTAFAILVVIARLISALVYGFAEIVEKKEKE